MARPVAWLTVALLLAGGCTPLGMWVYDDPSFSLRSVTLRPAPDSGPGVDSMELSFAGCNRNDYDLIGEELKATLTVHGESVGEGHREQPYRLVTRDTARVAVMVAMQPAWTDGHTELPVEVASELVLRLPNGERHLGLIQKGTLVMRDGGVIFKGVRGSSCRPGTSKLPNEFTRPATIERRD